MCRGDSPRTRTRLPWILAYRYYYVSLRGPPLLPRCVSLPWEMCASCNGVLYEPRTERISRTFDITGCIEASRTLASASEEPCAKTSFASNFSSGSRASFNGGARGDVTAVFVSRKRSFPPVRGWYHALITFSRGEVRAKRERGSRDAFPTIHGTFRCRNGDNARDKRGAERVAVIKFGNRCENGTAVS